MTGWLAYSWPEPVYYGYGTGGNVYYEGDTVYVDGAADCSAAAKTSASLSKAQPTGPTRIADPLPQLL